MQTTDPVLFACYILYVYFNGRDLTRLEREMRALGYPHFHRRILYPRGQKPGWIAKYNWNGAVGVPTTGAVGVPATTRAGNAGTSPGNAGALACMSAASARKPDTQLPNRPTPLPLPIETTDSKGTSQIPHSAIRTPHSDIPHSTIRTPHFPAWLRTVSSNMTWSWRHQQVIIEQLERVTRGDCKRLMIFLPPRHGKSELVTVRYTAWRMQRDPSMNVILGSYNQRLANRFSRKIRKVIADAEVGQTFQSVPAGVSDPVPDPPKPTTRSQEGRLAPASLYPQCSVAGDKAEPPASAGGMAREHRKAHAASGGLNSAVQPPAHAGGSAFPFISSKPANTVSEWETTAGGGFRSVGVGSGVTGFGASLIVIDDPVKSRAEAESETYRERVWDWFTDDLYTRLEPDGAIVLIQTRWHEDDLAGRLLRESAEEGAEQWDVVELPAIAESKSYAFRRESAGDEASRSDKTGSEPAAPTEPDKANGISTMTPERTDVDKCSNDTSSAEASHITPKGVTLTVDWRSPGEALCPERYNEQALLRIRRRLGEYSFAALYQQRPTPAEGGLFKREWFKKIIPFAPAGLKWKRGYDLAVSTKTNADYTASFRCAFDKEGNLYISGGFRARLEYPDQRRFIIERVKAETDTEHGIELALHGQALIQDLRRERGLRGHLLRGVKVEHDKYTRALTWAPLAEEGKVILVRNADCGLRSAAPGGNASVNERGDRANGRETIPQSALRIPQSWIPDFLDEVCSFPSAAHDDQVDAVSLAVQMLKGSGKRAHGF